MSLPAQDKKKAVFEVLRNGRSVASVAREFNVARKTIYFWIARYKKSSPRDKSKAFQPRYVSGNAHPKSIYPRARNHLIRMIVAHPKWGCRRISYELKGKGIALSYFSVNSFLGKLGAETPSARENFARNYSGPGRLDADIKLSIVKKVLEENEAVGKLSREYGVARKTIYKWLETYQSATKEGILGSLALKEAYVKGEAHPRALYPKVEDRILSLVIKRPELSVHGLKKYFPVSSWTIWSVLNRNGLNNYQARLVYAQGKKVVPKGVFISFFDRIKLVWEQ